MPGSSAVVQIACLPRSQGNFSGYIILETSLGGFLIPVRAACLRLTLKVSVRAVPNSYGLEPLTDIRVPIGAHFEPVISLRNPFKDLLQVKEVFTNDNTIHLSLPSVHEGSVSGSIWVSFHLSF
jgi:hypothetical protein